MNLFFKTLMISAAVTSLGACSDSTQVFSSAPTDLSVQTSGESDGYYKIGNPYQVSGVWYYPKEDYAYKEIGVASWYGADFHNGITANGELYDMHGLTAAHRTLPLPSIVRVTNLQNGRSLVLRVNDRGPFVNNRIIDVSMRAAQLLGFKDNGTTQVQVEILPEESKALRDEILALEKSGVAAAGIKSATAPSERAAIEEPAAQTVAPPKDLGFSPDRPRLANPRPAMDAPLITGGAPRETTQKYNDWDEDLPKAQAEKAYQPPVVPEVKPKPAPAPKKEKKTARKPEASPKSLNVTTQTAPGYYVQVGAFGSTENAAKMRDRVASFGSVVTSPVTVNGKTLYRVRIGPASAKKALETIDRVTKSGISGARLVEEKNVAPSAGRRLDNEF